MVRIAMVFFCFLAQSVVLGDGGSTGSFTDPFGNPVGGCSACFSFKFGSCESEFGPAGEIPNPSLCPPVECYIEGSCQLASNYYTVYDLYTYSTVEQIMVTTPQNASGYYARENGGKICKLTRGCDDCVVNLDTLLMSCKVVEYVDSQLKFGKICYFNHDNNPFTPPVPATCTGRAPWVPYP